MSLTGKTPSNVNFCIVFHAVICRCPKSPACDRLRTYILKNFVIRVKLFAFCHLCGHICAFYCFYWSLFYVAISEANILTLFMVFPHENHFAVKKLVVGIWNFQNFVTVTVTVTHQL